MLYVWASHDNCVPFVARNPTNSWDFFIYKVDINAPTHRLYQACHCQGSRSEHDPSNLWNSNMLQPQSLKPQETCWECRSCLEHSLPLKWNKRNKVRYFFNKNMISDACTEWPCRGGTGGAWPPTFGQLGPYTFDFLYKRTHSRRRKAHKNVTLSKYLMHFQPFTGLKCHKFCGGEHVLGSP